jgi:transposase
VTLSQAGTPGYCLHPADILAFARLKGKRAKTDALDAKAIGPRACPEKVARLFRYLDIGYPMSHEDMLQLFDFERVLFDHVIPRDREAL